MTRIIAGLAKGHPLQVPKAGTRPTSDRVRESLFSMLNHDFAGDFTQVRVLDLFAGTGGFALEALSRGALSALAIESNAEAVRLIKLNASNSKLPLKVEKAPVESWLQIAGKEKFDLIFLDPPYEFDSEKLQEILNHVLEKCAAENAIVLVERSSRKPALQFPVGWDSTDRKFGDTTVQKLVW